MWQLRRPLALALAPLLLAGCAIAEPPVPGGWSTYNDMRTYYRRNAMEWDGPGRCRMPYLDGVLKSEVVEETPERLQLDVTYHFRDQIGDDTGSDFFPSSGTDRCKGIEHRTFTFEKLDDGELRTVDMTGLRKGGEVPSLL